MTQAIMTKYLPCTNNKPSRVKAFCDAGNLTLSWEHGLTTDENHTRVAEELAKKLEWEWNHIGGCLPRNFGGYVFIRRI